MPPTPFFGRIALRNPPNARIVLQDLSLPATRGGAQARESLYAGHRGCARAIVRSVSRSGTIGLLQLTPDRSSVPGTCTHTIGRLLFTATHFLFAMCYRKLTLKLAFETTQDVSVEATIDW